MNYQLAIKYRDLAIDRDGFRTVVDKLRELGIEHPSLGHILSECSFEPGPKTIATINDSTTQHGYCLKPAEPLTTP
jgi:hypothetical protein